MLEKLKDRLRLKFDNFPKIDIWIETDSGDEIYITTIEDKEITDGIIKELYNKFKEETQN